MAPKFKVHTHCVGSMFMETVAPQEAEMGIMKILGERPSVKVSASYICMKLFDKLDNENDTRN